MTHFVYIVGRGSRWKDNELRYSLRSLERNFLNDYDVWIVGHCPEWIKDVHRIPCPDIGSNPILNVSKKILFALEDLPEEFVLMNDDFYIMRPLSEIPVVHGGPMRSENEIGWSTKNVYAQAYRETYKALRELHITEPLRYDRHIPFPMTKARIEELTVAWPSGRFLFKTVYGNLVHSKAGLIVPDVKTRIPVKQSPFWSSETNLIPEAKQCLMHAFPTRSPYERS